MESVKGLLVQIIKILQTNYLRLLCPCSDVRSLTSVIGEDELSDMDKNTCFGRLFEEYFINQGFDTNRSIEETLDLDGI